MTDSRKSKSDSHQSQNKYKKSTSPVKGLASPVRENLFPVREQHKSSARELSEWEYWPGKRKKEDQAKWGDY